MGFFTRHILCLPIYLFVFVPAFGFSVFVALMQNADVRRRAIETAIDPEGTAPELID
jgi:hypothetical protein